MSNAPNWETCHHLNATCPCPKVDGSKFCSFHCCPQCKEDKSSQAQYCGKCKPATGTPAAAVGKSNSGGKKKKKKPALGNNEEDNLKVLLDCGVLKNEEYQKRMDAIKEKAKKIHQRHKTPKSVDDVPGGHCTELVDTNKHEMVYKYTFDYFTKQWSKTLLVVFLDKKPFQEGAMREAYHMKDLTQSEDKNKHVAKLSKNKNEGMQMYFIDVEMQAMCQYFANEYNKRTPPKKVEFVDAFLIERFQQPGRPLMACEPYLEGEYVKYSNNYGYVSTDDRNTPQAFSHFSHWHSGYKYIVVDIQGVGDKYTDPQVHSFDGKGFGKGNVGQEGIDKYYSTHRCNAICKHLGLTDKVVDFRGTAIRMYKPDMDQLKIGHIPTHEELDYLNLSMEQFQYIVKAFKEADTDSSGEISLSELPRLCRNLNVELPTDQLVKVMQDIDTDGSGEVSFPEFLLWWTGHGEDVQHK